MSDLHKAINALIEKARLSGRLTHDDIIVGLSGFDIDHPDIFDEILERLVTEGIEVVDDDDSSDYYDAPLIVEAQNWERQPGNIEFDAGAGYLLSRATGAGIQGDRRATQPALPGRLQDTAPAAPRRRVTPQPTR